eukprot:TRINITY_DN45435_c0_g1_i1.p1 TRINITY_DN45435_c0_g1~~TRINITY_DN45435_c0_g1_i1.p1  ORF type:complete len:214 (+),score=50.92 TRINITY_DN45435_c0_g1_i1:25-666(+)
MFNFFNRGSSEVSGTPLQLPLSSLTPASPEFGPASAGRRAEDVGKRASAPKGQPPSQTLHHPRTLRSTTSAPKAQPPPQTSMLTTSDPDEQPRQKSQSQIRQELQDRSSHFNSLISRDRTLETLRRSPAPREKVLKQEAEAQPPEGTPDIAVERGSMLAMLERGLTEEAEAGVPDFLLSYLGKIDVADPKAAMEAPPEASAAPSTSALRLMTL